MSNDHPRISTREVCELARYTAPTLHRRIKDGRMPKAIDRGGGGLLFDRTAVLIALGMGETVSPVAPVAPWDFDPVKYAEVHARNLLKAKLARQRDKRKVAS